MTLVMLIYHQLTTLVPMFPWNDVERNPIKLRLFEAAFNGLFMALACVALYFRTPAWNDGLGRYPLIYFPILLAGEFHAWWFAYFFGNKGKRNITAEVHQRTLKVLPSISDHPIPDCNHMVLHAMTVATTGLVYATWMSAH